MVKLTDEQRNDDLVKSLLSEGYSEEVISDWVNSGAITLKSIDEDDDDEDDDEATPPEEKKSIDSEEDDDPEEGDDSKEDKSKKSCNKGGCLNKSIDNDLFKSLEESVTDSIMKSLPATIAEILRPLTDELQKSIDEVNGKLAEYGKQKPSFKGAGLEKSIIEKALEMGGGAKDEDNKTILSTSHDRLVVRELLQKSIDECEDTNLQKSLRLGIQSYMIDPLGGQVSEEVARYMYEKKNVRLVK